MTACKEVDAESIANVLLPRAACPEAPGTDASRRLIDRMAPALLLKLGSLCNQSCLFCICWEGEPPGAREFSRVRLEGLRRQLGRAAELGFRKAMVLGGEPTIRDDFWALLEAIRDHGFAHTTLATNGLMLAYPDFAERVAREGVGTIHLSIHDFDERVAPALSRNPATARLQRRALENVLARTPCDVYLYSVLTRLNAPNVKRSVEAADRIMERTGRRAEWIWSGLELKGRAVSHFDQVFLPLEDTAKAIKKGLAGATKLGIKAHFQHAPLCVMAGHEKHCLDLCCVEQRLDLETGELLPARRAALEECAGCRWESVCAKVAPEHRGSVRAVRA